jgi:hypothetical protein
MSNKDASIDTVAEIGEVMVEEAAAMVAEEAADTSEEDTKRPSFLFSFF